MCQRVRRHERHPETDRTATQEEERGAAAEGRSASFCLAVDAGADAVVRQSHQGDAGREGISGGTNGGTEEARGDRRGIS